jgi:hypothetical protein
MLEDIWPSQAEVADIIRTTSTGMFRTRSPTSSRAMSIGAGSR